MDRREVWTGFWCVHLINKKVTCISSARPDHCYQQCKTTGSSKDDKRHFLLDDRVTGLRNGCGDPVQNSQKVPKAIWDLCSPMTPDLLLALSTVPHFITPEVFDSVPEKRKLAYIGNALSDIGGVNFVACVLHVSPARPSAA